MKSVKELNRMKEEIASEEKKQMQAEAKYSVLMEKLKKDWKCKDMEAAEALLDGMESELEKLHEKYKVLVEKIEEKME